MKRFWSLILIIAVFVSSNTAIFADENISDIISEDYYEEDILCNQDISITYLTIAEPSIELGEKINILLGIEPAEGLSDVNIEIKNNDTNNYLNIDGEVVDSETILFSSVIMEEGCFGINSINYAIDGEQFTLSLPEMEINAQFGVGTTVMDSNPDAYFEEEIAEDNSDIDTNMIVLDDSGDVSVISDSVENAMQSADEFSVSSNQHLTIVLDPGHGGTDGGASRSYNGKTFSEKELNLKIAQYCRNELLTYGNVSVYMTRESDVAVDLEDRVAYAKSVNANVFISIHNNASSSSKANGAEVYYPNSSYRPDIGAEGSALASNILSQLTSLGLANGKTHYRNSESGDTYDDGSICDYYKVIRRSKQAGFPGVIIEHAYISNANDAKNYLGSEAGLRNLGVADATGIAKHYGLTKSVYNGVDYSEVFDAEYYLNSYSDLKNAFGNNSAAALSHFVNNGMREGRVGRAEFNPWYYKSQYVDLQKAFGNDMTLYYIHFKNSGIVEGRRGSEIYDPYSYLGYNQSLYDMFHYDFKSLYNYYLTYGNKMGQNATYNPSIYSVKLYKRNNETGLDEPLSVQNVMFGHSATIPNIPGVDNALTITWSNPLNVIVCDIESIAICQYLYMGMNYSDVFNPYYYADKYPDIRAAYGNDYNGMLFHFVNCGMNEGRQGKETFEVYSYRARYTDLQNAFGNDLKSYYIHYINCGKKENRNGLVNNTIYNVKFLDGDKVIKEEYVKFGRSATPPTLTKSGAVLIWDSDFGIITEDKLIRCNWKYIYNGIDYTPVFDAEYYLSRYDDLMKAFGDDGAKALQHFIVCGISENRQASSNFSVRSYKNRYRDLRVAFGNDMKSYVNHYLTCGKKEGRVAVGCEQKVENAITTYNGVDYSKVYDFQYYIENNPDVFRVYGYNDDGVLFHFVNCGMKEGRVGSSNFSIYTYRAKYVDLLNAFDKNWQNYYIHYLNNGIKEGRTAIENPSKYTVTYLSADNNIIGTEKVLYGKSANASCCRKEGAGIVFDKDINCVKSDMNVVVKYTYIHNGFDYTEVFDADYYLNRYPDIKNAFGYDRNKAFNHFIICGMNEGRQGSDNFNPHVYKSRYSDLNSAFGTNWSNYYYHYINCGIKEGRIGN